MKDCIMDSIDNAYIVLRPELYHRRVVGDSDFAIIEQSELKGVLLEDPRTDFVGIALSYNCDNMTETLIHECIHYCDTELTEPIVERLTKKYVDDVDVRGASQKKIVELCGKYDI